MNKKQRLENWEKVIKRGFEILRYCSPTTNAKQTKKLKSFISSLIKQAEIRGVESVRMPTKTFGEIVNRRNFLNVPEGTYEEIGILEGRLQVQKELKDKKKKLIKKIKE